MARRGLQQALCGLHRKKRLAYRLATEAAARSVMVAAGIVNVEAVKKIDKETKLRDVESATPISRSAN